MDVNNVFEVAGTPDRSAAAAAHNGHRNNIERMRNEPREKGKSVAVNGNRRLFIGSEPTTASTPRVLDHRMDSRLAFGMSFQQDNSSRQAGGRRAVRRRGPSTRQTCMNTIGALQFEDAFNVKVLPPQEGIQ